MHTDIERDYSHAVVLTSEDLAAIATLLAENYGKLSISASCSEGSKLSATDPQELLAYENPRFRRIESLTFQAGELFREGCSISIGTRTFSTFNLSISDDDDKRALKIADELGKRLGDCKPWYSSLTRITPMIMFMVLILLWAGFNVWHHVLTTGRLPTNDVPTISMFYVLLPFLLLYIVVFIYADRGWKWLFPKVWFLIGRQTKEFEKRARVRYWIFGAIMLGIIVSVIANLISHALTNI